jgi:16S rRNA processing protein RimM
VTVLTDVPRISVARVARTQGNRGEVAADLLTDFPERFSHLRQVVLEKDGEASFEVILDSFWFHKNRIVLKFQGIDSIDQAKKLAGYEVTVLESEKISLPAGTYFQNDLVGCSLISRSGEDYGKVKEVVQYGPNYLLRIQGASKEFLVPFAENYSLEIDLQEKVIRCDLPEGLEDL